MADEDRIVLGHIVGAHGIRGDVMLRTYTAHPEDIAAYGALTDEAGQRKFVITSVRVGPKGAVIRIKGVADRNAAEALRGVGLYVKRAQLPAPAPGEFYHHDLIGLAAVDPAGHPIGKVVAMLNYGAGDILEIEIAGSKDTELIPFKMAFVPEIDLTARTVVIVRPVETSGEPEEPEPPAG